TKRKNKAAMPRRTPNERQPAVWSGAETRGGVVGRTTMARPGPRHAEHVQPEKPAPAGAPDPGGSMPAAEFETPDAPADLQARRYWLALLVWVGCTALLVVIGLIELCLSLFR